MVVGDSSTDSGDNRWHEVPLFQVLYIFLFSPVKQSYGVGTIIAIL